MAKHGNLRIVLTMLDCGYSLPDHQTISQISIQTITGITGHMIVHIARTQLISQRLAGSFSIAASHTT